MPKIGYIGENIWPFLGANIWPFLGPNILIILGGGKSFGTNMSENPLGTPFALFFWSWHRIGQKGQYLALNDQNAYFGPNLAFFGSIILIFGKFWYRLIRKPPRHLNHLVFGRA